MQEEEFKKYLLKASDIYYGLSKREVIQFAYQYAKVLGIKYPEQWDAHKEASKDWYHGFMHRNPQLSLRRPDQISANRAKGFNAESVKRFYDNLMKVLPDNFPKERVWNMDETACPSVPSKPGKVIARKGARRVGQKASAE